MAYKKIDHDKEWRTHELERTKQLLSDAYDEIDQNKNSIRKLNRFISERGLAEEYIAWIIANRITTGEE